MLTEQSALTEAAVRTTDRLQMACDDALRDVITEIQVGMPESVVARMLESALKAHHVTDFWYEVPIMVLAGKDRFYHMAAPTYDRKKPSDDFVVSEGEPIFVDMHPRSDGGRWGNYARTFVLNPHENEDGLMNFLETMRAIQVDEMYMLGSRASTAEVAESFRRSFRQRGISPLDVRGNFGHNMGSGSKGEFDRTFIDIETKESLRGQIWGIEPGGVLQWGEHLLVARFEDCVHVPEEGEPEVLGNRQPFRIGNYVNPKPYAKPR